jgi:hypothetical protein
MLPDKERLLFDIAFCYRVCPPALPDPLAIAHATGLPGGGIGLRIESAYAWFEMNLRSENFTGMHG